MSDIDEILETVEELDSPHPLQIRGSLLKTILRIEADFEADRGEALRRVDHAVETFLENE